MLMVVNLFNIDFYKRPNLSYLATAKSNFDFRQVTHISTNCCFCMVVHWLTNLLTQWIVWVLVQILVSILNIFIFDLYKCLFSNDYEQISESDSLPLYWSMSNGMVISQYSLDYDM